MIQDTRDYLELIATGAKSTDDFWLAFGIEPFGLDGKYRHKEWAEVPYRVGEIDQAAKAAQKESAVGNDVYCCVTPRKPASRRKESKSASLRILHADIDAPVNLDRARELGLAVVGSGTEGHGHLYAELADDVTEAEYMALCRALGSQFDGWDKAKHNSIDVLRVPGTLNHKPAVLVGGEPAPVVWL